MPQFLTNEEVYGGATVRGADGIDLKTGWISDEEMFAQNPVTRERKFQWELDVARKFFATPGFTPAEETGAAKVAGKLPFVGAGIKAGLAIADIGALNRYKNGSEDENDIRNAAWAIAKAERDANADPSILEQFIEGVTDLPGYAAEFAVTGGAFSFGKKATEKAATKLLGKYAEKAAGRAAIGIGSRAVGVGLQSAANPQRVVENAAQRQLGKALAGEDNSLLESLPAGFADTYIELGSERAGARVMQGAGYVGSKIPGAKKAVDAIKNGVMGRWLARNPGATPNQFQEALKKLGYHGVIEEMLEERVGGVGRAAAGLHDWSDAVPTGEQLLVEGLVLSVPGAGGFFANRMAGQVRQEQIEAALANPTAEGLSAITGIPVEQLKDADLNEVAGAIRTVNDSLSRDEAAKAGTKQQPPAPAEPVGQQPQQQPPAAELPPQGPSPTIPPLAPEQATRPQPPQAIPEPGEAPRTQPAESQPPQKPKLPPVPTDDAGIGRWVNENPSFAAELAEKFASGQPISRRDFERAGLSTAGTTAQGRAEFAGKLAGAMQQQPVQQPTQQPVQPPQQIEPQPEHTASEQWVRRSDGKVGKVVPGKGPTKVQWLDSEGRLSPVPSTLMPSQKVESFEPPKFEIGQEVEATWAGGPDRLGVISGINDDGTYRVRHPGSNRESVQNNWWSLKPVNAGQSQQVQPPATIEQRPDQRPDEMPPPIRGEIVDAPQVSPPAESAAEPPKKGLRKVEPRESLLDRMQKRMEREMIGEELSGRLDELDEQGIRPADVVNKFFDETFDRLPEEDRRAFEQSLKRHAGAEPGAVAWTDREGNVGRYKDWKEIGKSLFGDYSTFAQIGAEGYDKPLKMMIGRMGFLNKEFAGKERGGPAIESEPAKIEPPKKGLKKKQAKVVPPTATETQADKPVDAGKPIAIRRVGDFYEASGEDAKAIARTLGLALTTRAKKGEAGELMAGFPYHHLQPYLDKLVASGFRVSVEEQSEKQPESPEPKKGLKKSHTLIGENRFGQKLYEDENGVRSIVRDNVRITEPVRLTPTREGVGTSASPNRSDEFKTIEELSPTETPPAKQPSLADIDASSLVDEIKAALTEKYTGSAPQAAEVEAEPQSPTAEQPTPAPKKGLKKRKSSPSGIDATESKGSAATRFQPGDRVIDERNGRSGVVLDPPTRGDFLRVKFDDQSAGASMEVDARNLVRGVAEKPASKPAAERPADTTAAIDAARAAAKRFGDLAKKKLYTNPFDPELMSAAAEMTVAYVKAGVLKFRDFVSEVRGVLGDELTARAGNYLKDSWDYVRGKFPESGMDAGAEVSGLIEKPSQEAKASTPDASLADRIHSELESGASIDAKQFFKMADEAYGGTRAEGTYGPSDAYDALETGVNSYLLGKTNPAVDAAAAKQQITELEKIIPRVPSQTNRSGEKDAFQQFSTPPAYAYAVGWVANIQPGDVVLEPSAGVGGIAIHAQNAGVPVYVNEYSKRRASLLRTLGKFAGVFTEDAEQAANILPGRMGRRPTVVLMNPPFSHAAMRMGLKKILGTDLKHVNAALETLEPGGRLVAITGAPLRGEETATFNRWLSEAKRKYNVKANIRVGRDVYRGYGTTFPTRVLVIDKNGPTVGEVLAGNATSLSDLVDKLEEIRNERQAPQRPETETGTGRAGRSELQPTEPASQEGAAETESGSQSGSSLQPPIGDRGTTEPSVRPAGETAVPGQRDRAGRSDDAGRSGASDATAGARGNAKAVKQPAKTRGDSSGTALVESERSGAGTGSADSGVEQAEKVAIENRRREASGKPKELGDSVFEAYRPSKMHIPGSQKHPGSIVESAAMASVEAPDITYQPTLPKAVVEKGLLSDIQLEAVTYAGQAHQTMLPADKDGISYRQGFMIGDGTGVGKGREVAGVILDNWMQGRKKAVWVTKNASLLPSAKRDWSGLGQDPKQIFEHSKVKSGAPIEMKEGILFTTYGTMRQDASTAAKAKGDTRSRVEQIVDWLGDDFDGVIAFDEAHEMAGAMPTATGRGEKKPSLQGLAGLELQKKLPKARVVYVSATSATEVHNLAYADRLGLWGKGTQFANVMDFVAKIHSSGIAAMELVARDMKALGRYLARSLSFDDGTEKGTVTYDRLQHDLTPEQVQVYNRLADAWQVTLNNFNEALDITGGKKNGRAVSAARSAFWSAHQRFFNQIITSMQLPSVLRAIEKDLKSGSSVVIQLTNTGESAQERALAKREEGDDLSDFDSSPADVLRQMVEKSFPTQEFEEYLDENGKKQTRPVVDSKGNPVHNAAALEAKAKLLEDLDSIAVPNSPLDTIIDHFGHEMVAEVTGRSRRIILMENERGEREKVINKRSKGFSSQAEIAEFQQGKKRILLFSEAGGTGASYHADLASENQQKRIHYLLQAGWKAAAAIQGLGRTHRSNQAQAPHYVLVQTNLKGQMRFISTIARRLAQLGALTKGQRQTGSSGVFSSRDNLEGEEAKDALIVFFQDLYNGKVPEIQIEDFEQQTGLSLRDQDGYMSQQLPDIRSFLNRILSLKVDLQNAVFDAFDQRLQEKVRQAEADGSLDVGVENVRADSIEKVSESVVYTEPSSGAQTKYVKLKRRDKTKPYTYEESQRVKPMGYVLSKNGRIYSAEMTERTRTDDKTGAVHKQVRLVNPAGKTTYVDLEKIRAGNYELISKGEAESKWNQAVSSLPEYQESDIHLITGVILPIWNRLRGDTKVRRLITDNGEQLLGRLIPSGQLEATLDALGVSATGEAKEGYTTQEALDAIDGGSTVVLTNGWKVRPARVQGEERIELVGPNFVNHDELKSDGVFWERVGFKMRYFLPAGERLAETFDAITRTRPIAKISRGDGESLAMASVADEPTQQRPISSAKPQRLIKASPVGTPIPASMDAGGEGELQSAQEIVATMSRLFDVPIRSGRVNLRKTAGIYKIKPEVVRLMGQASADIAVAAHEVAHHWDKTTDIRTGPAVTREMRRELAGLDYDQGAKRPIEGFAEFVRIYMTHGADALRERAPKFLEYFERDWLAKNPDVRSKVDRIISMIDRWRSQGAVGRAEAGISKTGVNAGPSRTVREALRESLAGIWQRFYRSMLNENYVLSLVDREAREKGYELKPGQSLAADMLAALQNAGLGHAARAAHDGVHSVVTGEKIGPSLADALEKISRDEYEDFRRFIWARHALEVYEKTPKRNPGIAKADAEWIVDDVRKSPEKFERYSKAADGVTAFNQSLLEMLVEAGKLSRTSADRMLDAWETYIPLFRARDKKGFRRFRGKLVDLPDPIRRRRGSGRQILDPIESTLQQAAVMYDAALKHQIWRQVLRETVPALGGAEGMGAWAEQVPPSRAKTVFSAKEVLEQMNEKLAKMGIEADEGMFDELGELFAGEWITIWKPDYSPVPGKHIIRDVDKHGNETLYQLDPDLYETVVGMPEAQVPWFLRIIKQGVALLKLGAVELNPAFAAANAVRDWMTFQFQTQRSKGVESIWSPFRETAIYIRSEMARRGLLKGEPDEVAELWKEFGGRLSSRYGLDRDGLARMRHEVMGHRTPRGLRETLAIPVNTLRDAINVSEVGPRIAEFAGALREAGYDRRKGRIVNVKTGQVERPPVDVIIKAINAANDVTVNFGRMGRHSRILNQFIPFFNVAIQGQLSRAQTLGGAGLGLMKAAAGKETEGRERQWKRVFLTGSAFAAATIAYWLARSDDDDYEEQEDWLKYGYWTFTDDEGNPVLRIPRSYEYNFIPSFVEAVLNAAKSGKAGEVGKAAYQELARSAPNTGPALITPALEVFANYDFFREKPIENERLRSLRPGDRAMPYTTNLMKAIGNYLNISPAKLEHYVNSATGGAYRSWYASGERLASGKSESADIPFVGAFRIKKDYPKSVDEFYAEKDRLTQEYNSAKLRGLPSPELADKHHRFEEYATLMNEMRKSIHGESDRDKRFEVEKWIVGLARHAMGEPELERYPNPLNKKKTPPEAVAKARDRFLRQAKERMTRQPPKRRLGESVEAFRKRVSDYQSLRRRSQAELTTK